VSPILDSQGVAEGVVVVLRDVTLFRRTEEQYQRARHLDGMQRLAEGIAHNLNNLVTVISGYSESLASALRDSDPQLREARMIQQASERASFLIRQLMLFSRRQQAEPKLLDLNTCFAVMENMLRPMLGCDIGLMTSFGNGLHKVEADPRHIEQILMTLVLNAREAMPAGGVISLRTSNVDLGEQLAMNYVDVRPGEYVLLEVSDTGDGMDYATQSHLFEPFFTTKEPRRAMGLGLAALYGMVKQAGGHVAFESEPGAGTRFLVYLPKADEPRPSDADAAPLTVPRAGAETVLVVEDDLPMRLLTREILLHQGYHVLEAANGSQALSLLNEHDGPIHLMVSDIIMPGMSGFELATRLATAFPDVKILFMSAFSPYALTHHGAVPGTTRLLQKPFTAETLIEKVREALNG
jgi:two-component system cell cycle sensor histidine kinase/response regulator CckA